MNSRVQAETEVAAGLGRAHALDLLDHASESIAQHAPRAGDAAQALFEGELDAFLPDVVDVGEADHVSSHLTERIVASVLALQVHAGHADRLHRFGQVRRHVAFQIDEFARAALCDDALQVLQIQPQQGSQLLPAVSRRGELARIGPDGIHRRGDGQRHAVAIEDLAAVRGNRHHAQVAGVALTDEKVLLRVLEVHRPPQQAGGDHQQQQPDEQPTARKASSLCVLHAALLMG